MFVNFSGAENCWQKFWQSCQNGYFYNLSSCFTYTSHNGCHDTCFLFCAYFSTTVLFPHCSLFKTKHITSPSVDLFGSNMFMSSSVHLPPSSSKDRPQLEALQSQTESLIQALGSIFARQGGRVWRWRLRFTLSKDTAE